MNELRVLSHRVLTWLLIVLHMYRTCTFQETARCLPRRRPAGRRSLLPISACVSSVNHRPCSVPCCPVDTHAYATAASPCCCTARSVGLSSRVLSMWPRLPCRAIQSEINAADSVLHSWGETRLVGRVCGVSPLAIVESSNPGDQGSGLQKKIGGGH